MFDRWLKYLVLNFFMPQRLCGENAIRPSFNA